MRQKRKTKSNKDQIPTSIVVMLVLIILPTLGWVLGGIPYALKYIECGKLPTSIESPGFWSGSAIGTPQAPGDEGYGPGFGKTYVCSSKDDLYPDNTPIHKIY